MVFPDPISHTLYDADHIFTVGEIREVPQLVCAYFDIPAVHLHIPPNFGFVNIPGREMALVLRLRDAWGAQRNLEILSEIIPPSVDPEMHLADLHTVKVLLLHCANTPPHELVQMIGEYRSSTGFDAAFLFGAGAHSQHLHEYLGLWGLSPRIQMIQTRGLHNDSSLIWDNMVTDIVMNYDTEGDRLITFQHKNYADLILGNLFRD